VRVIPHLRFRTRSRTVGRVSACGIVGNIAGRRGGFDGRFLCLLYLCGYRCRGSRGPLLLLLLLRGCLLLRLLHDLLDELQLLFREAIVTGTGGRGAL